MSRLQTAAKTREITDEPVTVMYARDKDAALRRYFPLVKYVVDKIAAGSP